MDRLRHVDAFIAEVNAAAESADVLQALRRHVGLLGFEWFTYSLLSPRKHTNDRFALSTYPVAWIARYHEQDYRPDDPVFDYAQTKVSPFVWQPEEHVAKLHGRRRQVINEAADFGLSAIGTVPINGPGSARATLTVACNTPSAEFGRLFEATRHELTLIALYAHERVLDQAGVDRYRSFDLSPRERETLTWAARGKTRGEIATILSVSDETVKQYTERGMRKLGAANKSHAIAIAIMHGLILP